MLPVQSMMHVHVCTHKTDAWGEKAEAGSRSGVGGCINCSVYRYNKSPVSICVHSTMWQEPKRTMETLRKFVIFAH